MGADEGHHTQLSPIFGLHADELGAATKLIQMIMSRKRSDFHATTDDGTFHENLDSSGFVNAQLYQRGIGNDDVFIADATIGTRRD